MPTRGFEEGRGHKLGLGGWNSLWQGHTWQTGVWGGTAGSVQRSVKLQAVPAA